MSSWGPGFVQKKGVSTLAFYHQVGFECYASEYFKMIRSVLYAQQTLDFLFIFDKVNSYSSFVSLFEHTLKKNNYIRYLQYFPSQGFNLNDRGDLVNPVVQQGPKIGQPNFFQLFEMNFQLQDSIREKINNIYSKYDIPYNATTLSICLLRDQQDFSPIFETIQKLNIKGEINVFIHSQRREDAERFSELCPSSWHVDSMWKTVPHAIVTEEQRKDELYSFLGSLQSIKTSRYLVGSHQNPSYRFAYCVNSHFRNANYGVTYDASSFSYF